MSLRLAYNRYPDKAPYRESLMAAAESYGLGQPASKDMSEPALVRALSDNPGPEELASRSQHCNQSGTQSLQGEADGVCRGKFVTPASLNILALGIKKGGQEPREAQGEEGAKQEGGPEEKAAETSPATRRI